MNFKLIDQKEPAVHGGSEIVMFCHKEMTQESAEEFVNNTNAIDLASGLQCEREDHLDGHCEIISDFDPAKGSYFAKITFVMQIEDMPNVERWCATENFEIVQRLFGTKVG